MCHETTISRTYGVTGVYLGAETGARGCCGGCPWTYCYSYCNIRTLANTLGSPQSPEKQDSSAPVASQESPSGVHEHRASSSGTEGELDVDHDGI